mgnify:CR=1 FL=1
MAFLTTFVVAVAARLCCPSHFDRRMVQLLKFRSQRMSQISDTWCFYDVLLLEVNLVAWMMWGASQLSAPYIVLCLSIAFRWMLFVVPICDIHWLRYQASCGTEGKTVLINAALRGKWNNTPRRIYLRKQAVAQWKKLDSLRKVLHVTGPPGTGKSTIAWAWACHKAASTNIVWVQCDSSGGTRICLLVAGSAVLLPDMPAHQEHRITDQIALCAQLVNSSVVIVDGITQEQRWLLADVSKWANETRNRKAVLVTSGQVVFKAEFAAMYRISQFSLPSWTWEQYVAACDDPKFFKDVRENLGWTVATHGERDCKRELMKNKFHFAGFSARWMFAMSADTVNNAINTHLRAIANGDDFLATMAACGSSPSHPFVSVDDFGNVFFVSKAAMHDVAGSLFNQASGIRTATRLSARYHNGNVAGWSFEVDFLLRLQSACNRWDGRRHVSVTNTNGVAEHWGVHRRVHFYDVTDLGSEGNVNIFTLNTWYVPKKRHGGAFDVVMVASPAQLRFVLLTVSKSHSRKLAHLRSFGRAWEKYAKRKLRRVELVVVVPPGSDCRSQEVEGSVPWPITYRKVSLPRA